MLHLGDEKMNFEIIDTSLSLMKIVTQQEICPNVFLPTIENKAKFESEERPCLIFHS